MRAGVRASRRGGALLVSVVMACASQRPPAHTGDGDRRCTLRVSSRGISVDGEPVSRAVAVARCARTAGAMVVREAGAPAGAWPQLRADLQHAGVRILVRGPLGQSSCMDDPLQKGCS